MNESQHSEQMEQVDNMKINTASYVFISLLMLFVSSQQCIGIETVQISDLPNRIAVIKAVKISDLDKSGTPQTLAEFLDEILEVGEQSTWNISNKCPAHNSASNICLEYVAESEVGTTAILRVSCRINSSSNICSEPRIRYAKYESQTYRNATAIKSIRARHKVSNYEKYFNLSTIEIKKATNHDGYQIIGSEKFGFDKSKELKSVAAILDSIWTADICGTNDDTLELKLVLLKAKNEGINSVITTNISMYSDGDVIPRLMKLGSKLAKAIKTDIALQIIRTGSPECK